MNNSQKGFTQHLELHTLTNASRPKNAGFTRALSNTHLDTYKSTDTEKQLPTHTASRELSAGFIKTIFLTVIGLALLNILFGIDLIDYLDKERLLSFWEESVAGPLSYLWNEVVIGIFWNFIKGLFS